MPALSPGEVSQAVSAISGAASADQFAIQVFPLNIRWWDATTEQKKTLLAATSVAEIRTLLENYFKPINDSSARGFLLDTIRATDKRGRAYWFLEYLMESSRSVSQSSKLELSLIFKQLLYKTSATDYKLKIGLDQIPASMFRDMLRTFLFAGFIRVPTTNQQLVSETFEDLVTSSMKLYGGANQFKMRWRSDAREYADISRAGGFLAKARSAEGYAASLGMRETWHPFSDPALRQYMWFRKGHADNCLNSVVSVGTARDWQAYLPFPLMKDYPNKLQKKRIMARTGDNRYVPVTVGVSETWLYLFVMADVLALKTGKVGASFGEKQYPEIGVGEIPIGNVFGAVKFLRVYHAEMPQVADAAVGGKMDEAGFTAYPVESLSPPVTDFKFSKIDPQPPGVADVRKAFNSVVNGGLVHVKWTSSGFAGVDPEFSVGSARIRLSAEDIKALK